MYILQRHIIGHELDQLDPEEHEPFFEEKVRTILSEYWGITNTEELGETLGDLLEAGGMSALYAQYANAETFEEIAQSIVKGIQEGRSLTDGK